MTTHLEALSLDDDDLDGDYMALYPNLERILHEMVNYRTACGGDP